MEDQVCRQFFRQPEQTLHRRYEALRAVFIDCLSLNQVADRFGYRPGALKSLVSRFRAQCRSGDLSPFFSAKNEDALRVNLAARTRMVRNSQ
jgi:hypothetical protein